MIRPLINCSRLVFESPLLMLLGFVVVVVPGGLLLMPVLASKIRDAKASAATHNERAIADLGEFPYVESRRTEGERF